MPESYYIQHKLLAINHLHALRIRTPNAITLAIYMTTTSSKASKHAKQVPAFPSARHIYIVSLLMVQICRITCHKETPLSNPRQSEFPPHHRQTDSPYHTSDLVACLRIGNSNPLL